MRTWLQRILSRGKERPATDDPDVLALAQMRADLDADPSGFPLDDLRPVLIPSPILELGRWVGPYHFFDALPVSLTWAYLRPNQTMHYLSTAGAEALEARGLDWRARARSALRKDFEQQPWTNEFYDDRGEVEAVALLHADGLGPSRLLCCDRLLERFPQGFSCFVPERSTALVLSQGASDGVRASVRQAVEGCLEVADVPMSAEPFSSSLLKTTLQRVQEYV